MRIAVGVPAYKDVSTTWMQAFVGLRFPEPYALIVSTGALTDTNRNEIVAKFLGLSAEWLYFFDDDTVPPPEAPLLLMETARASNAPFVTGVYYKRAAPFDPIIYRRLSDGLYQAIIDQPDKPFYVDACGLGCTLIHRSAFERVKAAHRLVYAFGKPFPVPLVAKRGRGVEGIYFDGTHLCIPASDGPQDAAVWPFFMFFGGRTEDIFFAELCREAGVRIVCDPRVQCGHIGEAVYGRPHLEALLAHAGREEYDRVLGGYRPEVVERQYGK